MLTNTLRTILFGALLVACGHTHPASDDAMPDEREGAPIWVSQDCQLAFEGTGPILCGVGSMAGSRNPSLARTSAIARARTDLARKLQVRVKAMIKDYQATTSDDLGTSDEQHVVDVSKQVTSANLVGTRVEQTWISSHETLWALVVLDLESFEQATNGLQQLDAGTRRAIIDRADKAFRELDGR